ncbi:undecaprenyl-diphosphate phosphatase [Abyssicoccus albus]|uniref:undecaprenyl-diphosphate phosphatase n=1 Tax=Abyssicoccus albus TaxID=1817405 RepID=UPI0038B3DC02
MIMQQLFDWIEFLKYVFLGLVQGVTEPIPISSSGHLVLLQEFLGIGAKGFTFEILVNTASLIAVVIIYWKDIVQLFIHFIQYIGGKRSKEVIEDFKFVMYLIIATIPAGILGLLLEDFIGDHKSALLVGIMLIVTGIALWVIRNNRGKKFDGDLTLKDAIIVGFAQAVALIPGISRSGATIVGAMGVGMNQKTALKFSFLLYIPISLGTALLGIKDIINEPPTQNMVIAYIGAFIASLVASYISLKWLQGIMAKGNLFIFSLYCFIVGPLVIILSFFF